MEKPRVAWLWLVMTLLFLSCLASAALIWLLFTDAGSTTLANLQVSLGSAASELEPTLIFIPNATRTPFQPLPTSTITFTPTRTSTPTQTFTPTFTSTPTKTKTRLPTRTRPPTHTPGPPQLQDTAAVHGIIGHPQLFTLDCEARSAVDMAAYFGVKIKEMDFLNKMPTADNPNDGFVGDYHGARGRIPPNSYGIYAGPVARLLQSYGLKVKDHKDLSWDDIRNEITNGRPVMAWVVGNVWSGSAITYTAPDGSKVPVVHFEHTVLVIGYTPKYVTILDGDMVYYRSVQSFLDSWSVLGNMAITAE